MEQDVNRFNSEDDILLRVAGLLELLLLLVLPSLLLVVSMWRVFSFSWAVVGGDGGF